MHAWAIRSIPGIAALSSLAALTALGCGGTDDPGAGAAGTGGASAGTGGSGETGGSGGMLLDGGVGGSAATEAGVGGSGGTDPLTACGSNLTGIVRDFRADHPDFECTKSGYTDPYGKDCGPWDPNIVGAIGTPIGPNRKPTFAQSNKTPSTNGPPEFDQWFNDVAGVNMSQDLRLDLVNSGSGSFVYDTNRFFPIDGELFDADPDNPDHGKHIDDDGAVRNYHFTYELHTTFKYEAGSVFTFRGDDDVFVYIDDKLVVNLGGIHVALQGRVNLDAKRLEVTAPEGSPNLELDASLGFTESIDGGVAASLPLDLIIGQEYTLDFFFAERNCCGSNFRMETNLVFIDCGAGTPK